MNDRTLAGLIADHVSARSSWRRAEHRAWQALAENVALDRATRGQDARGVKHSHQYRIPNAVLCDASELANQMRPVLIEAEDFEEILDAVNQIRLALRGLGPMWAYDAAERIGAHRGIVPLRFVYVQRGALVGARRLGLVVIKGRVRYADLPEALRVLDAGEVEDFLCVNKTRLAPSMLDR